MPDILQLLRASWQIYRNHAALLSGLFAWLLIPKAGVVLLQNMQDDVRKIVGTAFLTLLSLVLAIWVVSIAIVSIRAILEGEQKLNLDQVRSHVRPLLLPFILTAILKFLVTFGGYLLLIVPGIIFSIWYAFVNFAVLLDRKRVLEAFTFSRNLVRGRFWSVFARLVGWIIVVSIIYSIPMSLLTLGWSFLTDTPLPLSSNTLFENQPWIWIGVIDSILQTLVIFPILLIYGTALYLELKKSPRPA